MNCHEYLPVVAAVAVEPAHVAEAARAGRHCDCGSVSRRDSALQASAVWEEERQQACLRDEIALSAGEVVVGWATEAGRVAIVVQALQPREALG